MIDFERLQSDPCAVLREALEDDDVKAALNINRRLYPDGGTEFEPDNLQAIDDPIKAKVYVLNLCSAAQKYHTNSEQFRLRHELTQERTANLVKHVYPSLVEAIEDPDTINDVPYLYMARLSSDELNNLVRREEGEDPRRAEKGVYARLGVLERDKFSTTGFSWPAVYRKVEEMIEKGYAHVNYRYGLFDAHLLYYGDLSGAFHFNSGVIGIGEHEQPFAEKLVRAQSLIAHAIQTARPAFASYEEEIGRSEVKRFARSTDKEVRGGETPHLTTQGTLYEASLTVVQALTMLAAQKQPGYEDADQFVADVIDQGVIERFARKMPFAGIIGPMSIRGLIFLDMLEVKNGEITLNHDLETAFAEARRFERDHALLGPDAQGLGEKDFQNGFMSYSGCPAAHDQASGNNSVTQMARLFKTAYKRV